jgi:DNA gyrase subunit A
MEIGLVRKIDIDAEMQQAYLDYAMSVIVARALPDARDGLKPVHRRILYAMHDMGLRPDSAYKKSARVVGEVLGKYHPHGEAAVYDALARMAQDFSLRALLVDGQGNFGSVDGDPPAAMRYTEARLAPLANYILADIAKNTVNFSDNFDGTLTEPDVLPAAFPNLLVNGATGIAVGMATSIPPHNLGEVTEALNHLLANWEKLDDVSVEDLMHYVKGPDFPTGGVIIQDPSGDGLVGAYATGRGRVTVQARAHLEEMSRGRNRIIVSELPYMTNKAALIERIAELVRDERIEGIADLRDESDRHGMRIVIELSKTAEPEKVLRELYKSTPMRSTFSIIMLALVDGEPRLLSLKQALRVYLEHRLEIVRRRSEFDLEKARQRSHILQGLRIALQHLDEVIALIRKAPDAETARTRLMRQYKLSEAQSQAILDMPLRRLAALERKKIEDEYKEVQALIKGLEALLRSPKRMRQVVGEELLAVKEAFGDPRRTQIVSLGAGETQASLLTTGDFVPEQFVWVMTSPAGLIAHTQADRLPEWTPAEPPQRLVRANTRDTLYLVAENGEAAAIPMHVVPQAVRASEGALFHKISPLSPSHKLVAAFGLPPQAERPVNWHVMTVSSQGMVKKSPLSELPGPAAQPFTLVKINPGDSLVRVLLASGQDEVLLLTANGMSIRFKEDEVRPMGLVAAGVTGMKLAAGDRLVGAEIASGRGEAFLAASDGTAKRLALNQFPVQGRYGQGVVAWNLPRGVNAVGLGVGETDTPVTLYFDDQAGTQVRLDSAARQGRAARGKAAVELPAGRRLVGLSLPWDPLRQSGAAAPPEFRQLPLLAGESPEGAGPQLAPSGRVKAPRSQKPAVRPPPESTTSPRQPGSSASTAKTAAKRDTTAPTARAGKAAASKAAAPKPPGKQIEGKAPAKGGVKTQGVAKAKPAGEIPAAPSAATKPAAGKKAGPKAAASRSPAPAPETVTPTPAKAASTKKTPVPSATGGKKTATKTPTRQPGAGAKRVSKTNPSKPAGKKTLTSAEDQK